MESVKSRTLAFISEKGLKMKEFEDMAQLSTGYVTSMRKGYGIDKLNNVLKAFPDLNRDWLLYGEGNMLKEESVSENTEKPVIVWSKDERASGIPIYDVDFACSFVEMYSDHSIHPVGWMALPPYNDPERYAVVRAVGDSMSPDIEHGALIIIGRTPLPIDRIFYGDIYGIETTDEMRTIKRVVRADSSDNVRLVPSNPAYGDYQDFPTAAIRRVYKVFHVLNQKSY